MHALIYVLLKNPELSISCTAVSDNIRTVVVSEPGVNVLIIHFGAGDVLNNACFGYLFKKK